MTYADTLTEGVGERVAVRVQYTYSTRTATDTLTERGRGESGSTCTVHVPPQLLWLTRILWQKGVGEWVAVRVQYTYSTRTATDTLTETGRGESGSTCTVHVLPRILWQRGVGERVAVRVQYTYRHSYCDLRGYSDRVGQGSEWQYVYSTRTVHVLPRILWQRGVGERVAVRVQYTHRHSYCDLRGYSDRGGRGESGSTCTVHVQYTYCHGYSDREG